ncbi:hypothetical protein VNO77_43925 [Canavalia gladiata]|uniref:Uncharacterized protein n=1 Tax=Canavalia gladiata TaxID=3824 RepID=A0AAN9JX44_CANGL
MTNLQKSIELAMLYHVQGMVREHILPYGTENSSSIEEERRCLRKNRKGFGKIYICVSEVGVQGNELSFAFRGMVRDRVGFPEFYFS